MTKSAAPFTGKIFHSMVAVDGEAYLGVLKVKPVNLAVKEESDQYALHGVFQELLDSVSYPLYLYSRQDLGDLDRYVNQIRSGTSYTGLRTRYAEYCQQLSDQGFVDTTHYVVVRVEKDRYNHSRKELSRRINQVSSIISGSELDIDHVTGSELQEFVKSTRNKAPEFSPEYCGVRNDYFGEYRKLVWIDSYPSWVEFGWPIKVLQINGLVDVIQVFEPVGLKQAVTKLRRRSERLNAEIAAHLRSGHRGTNRMEQQLDDIEWFLDLLARQECRPVRYGVYLTVHAPRKGLVEAVMNSLDARLNAAGFTYRMPGYRNDHAYYTDSPFYSDRLEETKLVPTTAAATGFPFGTQPFQDQNGVVYGTDTKNGTPILLDRFNWDSHSMAVMGTLGSGKSYLAKLELLRSILIYPQIRIIVVDPKKEYRSVVEALGGEHRYVASGKDYSFDKQVLGFEVEERGEYENIAGLVDLVRQIYSATSKNQDRTLVLIDEARLILKDDAGRHALNQFVLEARDINVALNLVTQSYDHFTESSEGEDIFNNIPGKIFLRHEEPPDTSLLSHAEETSLQGLKTGEEAGFSEAYLHVSNIVKTKIKVRSTELEHQLIEAETGQEALSQVVK